MLLGSRAIFASVVLSLAACVGNYSPQSPDPGPPGPGPGPMTPGSAAALFVPVQGELKSNCASCHQTGGAGPSFLGDGPQYYYNKLVTDARYVNNTPSSSLLLTKGAHEGPALSAAMALDVTAWLNREVVERTNLPPPPPLVVQPSSRLAQFGACMTYADYQSTGMNTLQDQDTVGQAGQCWSCHSTGLYVYLSTDANANFARLQKSPWILKFADASVDATGNFLDIIATNRFRDRGMEAGHPQYILADARIQALSMFFTLTYNRWKAGGTGGCAAMGPVDGGATD